MAFSLHLLAFSYVTILNWYYKGVYDCETFKSASYGIACLLLSLFCKRLVPKNSVFAYDYNNLSGSVVNEDAEEFEVKWRSWNFK